MEWNQMLPEFDVFNIEESINFYVNLIGFNIKKENNYNIFCDMEEHWYRKDNELLGCKEFLVQDPNGYLLRFSEDLGSKEV